MLKKSIRLVSNLTATAALAAGLSMPQLANASEPFLGQIQMIGFNFAPSGWATCDGQLLQISQNTALFSLLGTTFGGDGEVTFGLPDMRGRDALHVGNGPGLTEVRWGQKDGVETVTMTQAKMANHTHAASTTVSSTLKGTDSAGDSTTPGANILASKNRTDIYRVASVPDVDMHADSVASTATTTVDPVGGGQAINVRNPYIGVYHVIALVGVFPSSN